MAEYDVGYGKPPKNARFKKGQSGNPNGRPKGSKNISTIIAEVCTERVRVKRNEDGTFQYMTKIQAIMTQVANQAARGDLKAARALFQILGMFPQLKEPEPRQRPIINVHFVEARDRGPGDDGEVEGDIYGEGEPKKLGTGE